MSYDLNGNLATLTDASGTTTHAWNARNQLAGLSGPGLTASFGYDGLGRRRTKTINGARTDFLYDGLNPVQEGVLPGTVGATLLTGLGIDEYYTRTDAAGTRSLLRDALGSTVALTDPSGAVSTDYTYEPFGATTVTGAASGNPFQYTGRENDGAGLYYYRARYYHPGLSRFVSEDPLGLIAGPNVYAYVNGAPTQFTDPLGLDTYGVGASGSIGLGKGVSGGVSLVWDSCRWGFAFTVGGGGMGGAGWAVTGEGQWTNASGISSLTGWGASASVSGGLGLVGGGGFIGGGGYLGFTGALGVGGQIGPLGTPVTFGGEATYTWIPFSWDIPWRPPCGPGGPGPNGPGKSG